MSRAALLAAIALMTVNAAALPVPPGAVEKKIAIELPNVPGKQLTVITVAYPPRGASKPHQHPQSGFIFAYVLTGRIESQVEGSPAKVFGPGESWVEGPGAHHLLSRNASSKAPAKLLVIIIADPGVPLSSPIPSP